MEKSRKGQKILNSLFGKSDWLKKKWDILNESIIKSKSNVAANKLGIYRSWIHLSCVCVCILPKRDRKTRSISCLTLDVPFPSLWQLRLRIFKANFLSFLHSSSSSVLPAALQIKTNLPQQSKQVGRKIIPWLLWMTPRGEGERTGFVEGSGSSVSSGSAPLPAPPAVKTKG